jgi:hypothetical protein
MPAGAWSAKFAINTTPVAEGQDVKIEATDGSKVQSEELEVQAPILSAFAFIPPSVIGGASSTGKITINGPAPAGGLVVTLVSPSSNVIVPETVTVPKSATYVTFTAKTTKVLANANVTITAIAGPGWLATLLTVGTTDFADSSFETPLLKAGSWQVAPTGSGWTWNEPSGAGQSGIANGSGSWGTGAHSGAQYAFIQDGSSVQQTLTGLVVGQKYVVQFWMATRNGDVGGNTPAPMVVTANGTAIFGPTTPSGAAWVQQTSATFTATQTSYTFVFKTNTGNGDSTDLIDDVHLVLK